MKKLSFTAFALSIAVSTLGQGAITWGNSFGSAFRAVMFAPQTDNATLSLYGQSGQFFGGTDTLFQDNPVGTLAYNGLLLSGTRYIFAVFTGPVGNNLSFLGQTTFNTSTTTLNGGNAFPKGYVNITTVPVPGVGPGNPADYQIRVWDTQNGNLTSWAMAETAWLSELTAAAVSPVVTSDLLGGVDAGRCIIITPITTQFRSFNIYYTPEPGSFALVVLGAAAMLIFRRRK